ncbi:hypothetical protein QYF36_008294 [Acer negundo]|nr:hypothetical protein QYF36_008294 [Acer negundo]
MPSSKAVIASITLAIKFGGGGDRELSKTCVGSCLLPSPSNLNSEGSLINIPMQEKPSSEDLSEVQKWKCSVRKAKKINQERHSQRCDTELELSELLSSCKEAIVVPEVRQQKMCSDRNGRLIKWRDYPVAHIAWRLGNLMRLFKLRVPQVNIVVCQQRA